MEIANVEMAAAWDGDEGDHWTEHAERYESSSAGYGRRLLEAAQIAREDAVLDVGCGTGKTTRDAARVAVAGSALGVDLSARMIEHARTAAAQEGLTNVTFERADVQVHPFPPGSFDRAMSLFGAMFFADPVAAFSNVAQSLRPGGLLTLLAWRELADNEWIRALRDALAVGRTLPVPPPGTPGPFGLADPEQVRQLLAEAGYDDVAIEPADEPMWFGADASDAMTFVGTFGIARGLTQGLDDDQRRGAFAALRATLEDHDTAEGVRFASGAWLVTARRP